MKFSLVEIASRFVALTDEEALAIEELIPVVQYKAGTILLQEGQISQECFFILQGCIRQYVVVDGVEKTTDFFTEEQAAVSFTSYAQQVPARHFFACVEDTTTVVGRRDVEADMYLKFPKFEQISRIFMTQDFGKAQESMALFMTSSPEDRYRNLLETRPELLHRVPQHQLASYLGVTPESLSRIRKRIALKR